MAKLDLSGYDELVEAFNRISNVPDEVLNETLTAMEQVAAPKIRASGEAYDIRNEQSNVHVLDKIKMGKPKKTQTGGYADITFTGSRDQGKSSVKNSTIAFFNEFGTRYQQARPFVGKAMESNADAIANAGAKVLLDWTEKSFKG